MLRAFLVALSLAVACRAHWDLPINPDLGVPGFPDCHRQNPHLNLSVAAAAMDLVCIQRQHANASAIKIGCIGTHCSSRFLLWCAQGYVTQPC